MVRKALMVMALAAAFVVALAVPAFAQAAEEPAVTAEAIAFLVTTVAMLVGGSRGITWVVDRARDALPFGDDVGFKIVWPLLALAVALLTTLGFEGTNIIGDAAAALPKGTNALQGVAGEVMTAVVLAGLASSWHDRDKAKNPPDPESTG